MAAIIDVDAFILGAPKCGTTWLSNALEQHPGLCISNPKEPNIIATHKGTMLRDQVEPDLNKYAKYFKGPGKKIDCSVHAFACPVAPSRINKNWPNAKFIVCVREPISRTISHWRMIRETEKDINSGCDWSDFEKAWKDPRLNLDTLYGLAFSNWLEIFDRGSFLVIDAKEMRENPTAVLENVCDHLNIGQHAFDLEQISNSNKSEDRRKPTKLGRIIMKLSSSIPSLFKLPVVYTLEKLRINIYNSKGLSSNSKAIFLSEEKVSKLIASELIRDIKHFEEISGIDFPHWK
ncbi:MAG: sulfotransferase [Candidatus Poseidoniaceae archaeon]|jgi:hypothetical protein|nr:sulfotransferase [Candidatus Poseidoniaceae archaeon]